MTYFVRTLLRVLFFPLSLFFMRCGNSSLSSGAVVDSSQLRVNVNLSRSTDYDGAVTESIEAFIRDTKGTPVANPQIQVKVNGRKLALNKGSSNYYGTYPYYQLGYPPMPLQADTPYEITLVLTDGAVYTLGTIETQPDLTRARFAPPARHTRLQPLTLNWQDLEPHNWLVSRWKRWQGETSTTVLKISKSTRTTDAWKNVVYEGGSPNEADYLTTILKSGAGDYVIPATYFQGPTKAFNTLELLLISEKSLSVGKPFLAGSTISSSRTGLYRIDLTN